MRVARATGSALLAQVFAALDGRAPPVAVAFCNAHTAEIAFKDAAYAQVLAACLVVNDGVGVEIGARLMTGRGFPENLNGTDFLPRLFAALPRPTRVFLLGAKPGVAAEAAARFAAQYPHYIDAGARDGYFPAHEAPAIAEAVRATGADIALIALGNPAQERFMVAHLEAMGARAAFGVGALLDFTAGRVRRAPEWVRTLRAEWLYRLAQEPRRLARRYLIETPVFLAMALRLKAKGRG